MEPGRERPAQSGASKDRIGVGGGGDPDPPAIRAYPLQCLYTDSGTGEHG